jgi:hypothetical protein
MESEGEKDKLKMEAEAISFLIKKFKVSFTYTNNIRIIVRLNVKSKIDILKSLMHLRI